MRISRFTIGQGPRLGIVAGDHVLDLASLDPGLPTDLTTLLEGRGLDRLRSRDWSAAVRLPLTEVRLLAPLARPSKFIGIARNYAAHAAERGGALAQGFPVFFNKQVSCVSGPYDPIVIPQVSVQVDYEGELGVVIGERARQVKAADAAAVVAGYLVVNDVSVRDWQGKSPTMTLGKSFDTHGPIGPWLVTADEILDPHTLRIRTWVNGDLRQDAPTGDMLWNCWQQIETLSAACTLEPGDIIATGTPAGVGAAHQPPRWLRAGDRVRVEVEGIGAIENHVVESASEENPS